MVLYRPCKFFYRYLLFITGYDRFQTAFPIKVRKKTVTTFTCAENKIFRVGWGTDALGETRLKGLPLDRKVWSFREGCTSTNVVTINVVGVNPLSQSQGLTPMSSQVSPVEGNTWYNLVVYIKTSGHTLS